MHYTLYTRFYRLIISVTDVIVVMAVATVLSIITALIFVNNISNFAEKYPAVKVLTFVVLGYNLLS
jgi:predicted tellurium resistance membrane protein TerC